MKTNIILNGDALTHLKELPDQSINMVMTSPPYWALRDYGTADWEGGDKDCDHKIPEGEKDPKNNNNSSHNIRFIRDSCYKCGANRIDKQIGLEPTFGQYINRLCNIFNEVKRVLRDDGTCWVNIGDTYYGSSSYSNDGRAGFNEKDGNTSEWKRHFGEGKCLTCGKPCDTQFCNRDCLNKKGNDFRSQNRQLKDKCLTMVPFRFSIEMVNRGWILRNTIIWHKPNCMPSSVTDRFGVDFEYIFLFSKYKTYYFEQQFEPHRSGSGYQPFNKRVRDVALGRIASDQYKVSQEETDKYKEHSLRNVHGGNKNVDYRNPKGRNKRTTWHIPVQPSPEAHFATYPKELCETPIKAGCPEGGIVLDPFFGSGTTGLVALKQSKKFIGIELNPEYIEIANKRLKPYLEQRKLTVFSEESK